MTHTEWIPISDCHRRSLLYRKQLRLGARFGAVCDGALALHYEAGAEAEAARARQCGLADLSALPRIGFKGAHAIRWLRGQDLQIGEENNRSWLQQDGSRALRLSDGEVLLLDRLQADSGRCEHLGEALRASSDAGMCFEVPRRESSAWLLGCGAHSADMLAKLCGVDLRPAMFADGNAAQTSAAHMNVIVLRADLGSVPAYHLLFDCASVEYLWDCLQDAGAEFSGGPAGYTALRELAGHA